MQTKKEKKETAPCVPILTELFPKIQAVREQFGSSLVSG